MLKRISKIYRNIFFVCALAILANIVAHRFDRRWDVTGAHLHTLSAETKTFLSTIQEPVRVTVFTTGSAPRYLKDLLKAYEQSSGGKITAEIVDPLVNLGYAAQFGTVIDKNDTKVFLRSGEKTSDVDFTDEALTQDLLNFGLLRLNRESKNACFTAGHGEYRLDSSEPEGLKQLKDRLAMEKIQTQEIVFGPEPRVPQTCDLLVIAGPHTNFTTQENAAVEAYLKGGGDAFILVENVIVTTPEIPLTAEQKELNPSLNAFLKSWGLRVGSDIVVDLSSHISGDPGTPATRNYMKHPALVKNLDYTFYVRPRSITMLADRRKDIKLAPFVLSASKKSWAETNRRLQVKFDPATDVAGPVVISYIVWGPRPSPGASDTRMIVFTDADFLSNAFIGQFSNGQMAMNIINWLLDPDFQNTLTSTDSQQKIHRLDLTSEQKTTVGLALAAMPLVMLLAGLIVWSRRFLIN